MAREENLRQNERIQVRCPLCGKQYLLQLQDIGKKAKCICGNVFAVSSTGVYSLVKSPRSEPVVKDILYKAEQQAADKMITFNCSRCDATLLGPEENVGYPEVCPVCMNATIITDGELLQIFQDKTAKYKVLNNVLAYMWWFWLPWLILYLFCEFVIRIPLSGIPLVVFVTIVPIMIVLRGIGGQMRRKWIFPNCDRVEKKRQEICAQVLRLRAKGQIVRLCEMCAATGIIETPIFAEARKCSKCDGEGYLVVSKKN